MTTNDKEKKGSILGRWLNPTIDRRKFLKTTSALAGTAIVAGALLKSTRAKADTYGQNTPDALDSASGVALIRSTCQMCHGRCGIQAKVDTATGILLKIDGNSYNPQNMDPAEQVPYATDPATGSFSGVPVKDIRGRLCPRGQSGIQTLYNPYRVTQPLKRSGARGEGKWTPISWATAYTEIAAKINSLIPFASRTTTDIDSSIAALGKIANGLTVAPGRSVEGAIWERFFKNAYGTVNWRLDHTSICEESHHIANRFATSGGAASGTNGFFANHPECKYCVILGANPLEANFAMVPLAREIVNMKANGGKLVVVDPRFSNTATKADVWVAPKPGTDGAFAMGLARAILDNAWHRTVFLQNPNKKAAIDDLEPNYCDASWLVVTATGANKGKYLDGSMVTGGTAGDKYFWDGSAGKAFSPTSTTTIPAGTPALTPGPVAVTGGPATCMTAFELFKSVVTSKTLTQWAAICGVDPATITAVARGLAGVDLAAADQRKTAIWDYRGTVQHTNGMMASLAVQGVVNLLGNVDYRGGLTPGAAGVGAEADNVKKGGFTPPTAGTNFLGPRLDRVGWADPGLASVTYDTYTNYAGLTSRDGYPAKRPWFPFARLGNFQEVIPGVADQYPYPTKVLITYWNAFPYSVPALRKVFEQTVTDESKLPLFVAIDPIIGENSAFADYILPDTTYLEKWSFPGSGYASGVSKCAPFQQPVVGTLDGAIIGSVAFSDTATNDFVSYMGSSGPKQVTDIIRDLASYIDASFPGIGANGFGASDPFNNSWHFWKKHLSNFVTNTAGGATAADVVGKGGFFAAQSSLYVDSTGAVNADDSLNKYLANKYGSLASPGSRYFYYEPLVTTMRWDVSGGATPYANPGATPAVYGVVQWEGVTSLNGSAVVDDASFPYQLITYKRVYHGQARTHVNPWLMLFEPENYVLMSAADGRALGVETGDSVRVVSASNLLGVVGKAKVTQGLRPGVIAISHHYGHWEGGARPQVVSGSTQFTSTKSESWRGGGITPNGIMRLDDMFPNVSLQDRLGGSVAFNDTRVALEKVTL